MKITETSPLSSAAKLKKKKHDSDSGFGELLDAAEETESTEGAAPFAPSQNIDSLSSLLSLQEVSDEDVKRRRAMHSSQAALDSLEELRRELLFGELSTRMVARMEEKLAQLRQQNVSDPRLQSVIDDIELRLAVEVAKLQQNDML